MIGAAGKEGGHFGGRPSSAVLPVPPLLSLLISSRLVSNTQKNWSKTKE